MTTERLIELTNGAISQLWFCPETDARLPVLLIEPIAGPKRFRRVWIDQPTLSDDWTWFIPEDAIALIPTEDEE